jgi:hypothetical protein
MHLKCGKGTNQCRWPGSPSPEIKKQAKQFEDLNFETQNLNPSSIGKREHFG